MKKIFVLMVALIFGLFVVSVSYAGWDSCKGCHTDSGKPGPSKATMLKKFKTVDELVKAAKDSKNPMMDNFKNETLLKAAAKDMGLKDAKATKKEEPKKDVKSEDKTKKEEPKKDMKSNEPAKEATPKTEEPKKKKKAIEGC